MKTKKVITIFFFFLPFFSSNLHKVAYIMLLIYAKNRKIIAENKSLFKNLSIDILGTGIGVTKTELLKFK